jgi:hypothetical protein
MMPEPNTIEEAPRQTPIWGEYDVCVVGGSCTGVFAAVRAARLGMKVALVERMGCLGGTATLSLVNVWHSPYDEVFERKIIGGLTLEVMERLKKRGAVREQERSPDWAWAFNPAEMQLALDRLLTEEGVHLYLHTLFVSPYVEEPDADLMRGIAVENKSGRGILLARQFIDASGDGDVAVRLGIEATTPADHQPASASAIVSGWRDLDGIDWGRVIREHADEIEGGVAWAWGEYVPGSDNFMLSCSRVSGLDCSQGGDLTKAELEGRRQVREVFDLLRRHLPSARLALQCLPQRIGIRETRHIRCRHRLTGDEVLDGVRFEDAIANGSYRVDFHHNDKSGVTFKYLSGKQVTLRTGHEPEVSCWREPSASAPTFYQIPFRTLIPDGCANLLVAGRMIDTDPGAYAAVRIMVNMNQTGEAAGVAAALAVSQGIHVAGVNPTMLRAKLAEGGSIII